MESFDKAYVDFHFTKNNLKSSLNHILITSSEDYGILGRYFGYSGRRIKANTTRRNANNEINFDRELLFVQWYFKPRKPNCREAKRAEKKWIYTIQSSYGDFFTHTLVDILTSQILAIYSKGLDHRVQDNLYDHMWDIFVAQQNVWFYLFYM